MATRRVRREDWAKYDIEIIESRWKGLCPDCRRAFHSERPSDRLAGLLDEIDEHRKEHEVAA